MCNYHALAFLPLFSAAVAERYPDIAQLPYGNVEEKVN
jgi:hypothetical protein